MINRELITLNECQNDGSFIHLYYFRTTNTIATFGLSAYALRIIGKSNGINSIRGFSTEMQMPCTLITNSVINKILQISVQTTRPEEDWITVRIAEKLNEVSYERWTNKLKEEAKGINVPSTIDDDTPREKFIPDGMSTFSRYIKRICDFLIASFCLIIFSPLFLYCFIAVRREDGGPAIFKQERIGRFGKPFYIYKFRSMRLDAEKMGPQLSHSGGDNDPRLTKIGRFIRSHHLDELPQLWNVFRGDMAFVGPRPERRYFIDQILDRDKRYSYLYQIRPGVTSYATLYNGYTDTMDKMLKRLELDLYYLENRSWWLDIKVLFLTFCGIAFGKKL